MSKNRVTEVTIELLEEQSKMLHEHANRLRKALSKAPAVEPPADVVKGKKGDKPVVKRALSGFQVFMKEHLKSYRVRHPEIPPREILTIISQRWKSLSEEKKSKYLQEAAKLNKDAGKGRAEAAIANEEQVDEAKKRKRSESEMNAGSDDEKKKKKHKKHKKHDDDSS